MKKKIRQMAVYFLVFFALISVLSGCGCWFTAPDPFVDTPVNYYSIWDAYVNGQPIPECDRLDPFLCTEECEKPQGKMSLCALVDLGIFNSPELRQSWAAARASAAKYGEQQSAYLPEINFTAAFNVLKTSAFFGASNLQIEQFVSYGPTFDLTYLLFDAGQRREETEKFRQKLLEMNWSHNQNFQTVIQTIMNQYYTYEAAKEQVVADTASLMDAKTVLLATEKKHILGITDLSDVLIARTQVIKRENILLDGEQDEQDAFALLKTDVGIPANSALEVESFPHTIPKVEIDEKVDLYIAQAYIYRPDLYSLYAKINSLRANLQAVVDSQFPTFSLYGSAGQTSYNAGVSDDYDYLLQLSFQLPVFQGYSYWNQIRQAKAKVLESKAEFREFELKMIDQVVQSHQDFLLAIQKVKVNELYVKTANESFRSALAKYKAGTTDITTVVNSLSDLAEARNSLVAAKKEWYVSLTDLAYATGTLYRPCC